MTTIMPANNKNPSIKWVRYYLIAWDAYVQRPVSAEDAQAIIEWFQPNSSGCGLQIAEQPFDGVSLHSGRGFFSLTPVTSP